MLGDLRGNLAGGFDANGVLDLTVSEVLGINGRGPLASLTCSRERPSRKFHEWPMHLRR